MPHALLLARLLSLRRHKPAIVCLLNYRGYIAPPITLCQSVIPYTTRSRVLDICTVIMHLPMQKIVTGMSAGHSRCLIEA